MRSEQLYVAVGSPVAYWNEGRLVLHEPVSGRRMEVSPTALELLTFLQEPQSLRTAGRRFDGASPRALRRAFAQLQRYGLIAESGPAGGRPNHPLDAWGPWTPHASLFHFGTRDPRILHGVEGQLAEEDLALTVSDAPVERSLGCGQLAPLPRPNPDDLFSSVVRSRRTWRRFGRSPLALTDLSDVLHLTFGVQQKARTPEGHAVSLTTSPSAGAQQPLALYVAARRVTGVPPGLYRYMNEEHALGLIRQGVTSRQIETYLGHNWWFSRAALVVFIAGRVETLTGRYGHPRAYRFLLLEAGHVCQTFCLAATWKGLAPFCTAALADSRIERDCGMDGINEIVLYAMGVGTRPRDRYVPWPEHEPGKPYLPKRRARSGLPAGSTV